MAELINQGIFYIMIMYILFSGDWYMLKIFSPIY